MAETNESIPNILILQRHDLGTSFGCYGTKGVRSPRLDAFAEEGVRFDRAFCTTRPSARPPAARCLPGGTRKATG